MVELYKKLGEYDIELDIHTYKETVYFTFRKDGFVHSCPVHIDLIELAPDKAEWGLLLHLDTFVDTLK